MNKKSDLELAKNSTSKKELSKLSKSSDLSTRLEVSRNKYSGKIALTNLLYATDSNEEIFENLASHPNIINVYDYRYLLEIGSESVFSLFLNNKFWDSKTEVEKIELFKSIMNCGVPSDKVLIAKSKNCPKQILDKLSNNTEHFNVISAVINNSNTSIKTLKSILVENNKETLESMAIMRLLFRLEKDLLDIKKTLLLSEGE